MASSSASFQLRLQREVLEPQGEQLLALVHCKGSHASTVSMSAATTTQSTKGSRDIWLCLLNQVQQSQFHISIAELRASGSGGSGELPKRKRTWSVKELGSVDAGGDQPSFQLEFEKGAVLTWTAVNVDEKKVRISFIPKIDWKFGANKVILLTIFCARQVLAIAFFKKHLSKRVTRVILCFFLQRFLATLINLSSRHDRQRDRKKLVLKNVPEDVVLIDSEDISKSRRKQPQEAEETEEGISEDYEAISTREATDLMALMEKCDHAITNADVFAEDLAKELSVLDGANIHSIMASEESVASLMDLLERAVEHTEAVEARLDQVQCTV